MSVAYIGLGANAGDPLCQCRQARERIVAWPEVACARSSSLYRSEAHLLPTQTPDASRQWYVNAVLEIETPLSAPVIFTRLTQIEVDLGRDLSQKGAWLPRPIDLDLLAYDDLILKTPTLILPHPRIAERRFVLAPWAELAPQWRHPGYHRSIQDLLDEVDDDKVTGKLCFF